MKDGHLSVDTTSTEADHAEPAASLSGRVLTELYGLTISSNSIAGSESQKIRAVRP